MDHELTYVCIGCGYDTFNASRYCNACAVIAPTVTPTPELEEETVCHNCNGTGVTGWNFPCTYCDAFKAVCPPRATAMLARWEDARANVTRYAAATVATLALALLATIPHGCTVVGVTGEGFPLAHCADDSYGYIDLDGTDGALGTAGDGRWVQIP